MFYCDSKLNYYERLRDHEISRKYYLNPSVSSNYRPVYLKLRFTCAYTKATLAHLFVTRVTDMNVQGGEFLFYAMDITFSLNSQPRCNPGYLHNILWPVISNTMTLIHNSLFCWISRLFNIAAISIIIPPMVKCFISKYVFEAQGTFN